MSEEQKEKNEYYCHWCDTVTNTIVKELENGRLTWRGCPDCYVKKKEREQKDAERINE